MRLIPAAFRFIEIHLRSGILLRRKPRAEFVTRETGDLRLIRTRCLVIRGRFYRRTHNDDIHRHMRAVGIRLIDVVGHVRRLTLVTHVVLYRAFFHRRARLHGSQAQEIVVDCVDTPIGRTEHTLRRIGDGARGECIHRHVVTEDIGVRAVVAGKIVRRVIGIFVRTRVFQVDAVGVMPHRHLRCSEGFFPGQTRLVVPGEHLRVKRCQIRIRPRFEQDGTQVACLFRAEHGGILQLHTAEIHARACRGVKVTAIGLDPFAGGFAVQFVVGGDDTQLFVFAGTGLVGAVRTANGVQIPHAGLVFEAAVIHGIGLDETQVFQYDLTAVLRRDVDSTNVRLVVLIAPAARSGIKVINGFDTVRLVKGARRERRRTADPTADQIDPVGGISTARIFVVDTDGVRLAGLRVDMDILTYGVVQVITRSKTDLARNDPVAVFIDTHIFFAIDDVFLLHHIAVAVRHVGRFGAECQM